MLIQCFQVVAGAQQSLRISLERDRGRNYLNREAKHLQAQRFAGDDLFSIFFGD